MNRYVADPDRVRLVSYTGVTDIDIVIAGSQIDARARTERDVAVTGGVAEERERATGSIFTADRAT
jgi:hypothetical protein